MIKTDCFAYKNENDIEECYALNELNCENCKFYKHRDKVKNNIFYPDSFENEEKYIKEFNRYFNKYKSFKDVDRK